MKGRRMRRVLLCDLDGTLVDTAADLAAALNHLLSELGYPRMPEAKVRQHVGLGAARLIANSLAELGETVGEAELADYAARFLSLYESAPAVESRPYPGVANTLARLREAGWTLGVCTNKPQVPSDIILRELGLSELFAIVAGGDRFPVRKPDGGHILSMLEIIGASAEDAVLVGDSRPDFLAGRDAGVPIVLVNYGYANEPVETMEPDKVITAFPELPDALAEIGGWRGRSASG